MMGLLTDGFFLKENLPQSLGTHVEQKQTEIVDVLIKNKPLLNVGLVLLLLYIHHQLKLLPSERYRDQDLLHHIVKEIPLQEFRLSPYRFPLLKVVLVEERESLLFALLLSRRDEVLRLVLNEAVPHYK